jgi:Flp pilus assembly protein TadG
VPSRCPIERDAGTVTAELAVAVPAVLLVLAACLGGLRIGAERIRVTDAAAEAARVAARGDAPAGRDVVIDDRGDGTVCATVRRQVLLLGLPVPVVATGCALAPVRP